MVNTAEHLRKLRDEQTKNNQTRLQYDEFLKSIVYKWNPLFWIKITWNISMLKIQDVFEIKNFLCV